MEDVETLAGHLMDLGWEPHRPETWPYRYATLRGPVVMQHHTGRWIGHDPVMRKVPLPAGATVKIVMVSRLGDVGITEDMNAETGYGARVLLEDLRNFRKEP